MYLEGMKSFYEFSSSLAGSVSDKRLQIVADIKKAMKESKDCGACLQVYSSMVDIPHNVNDIARIMRFLR